MEKIEKNIYRYSCGRFLVKLQVRGEKASKSFSSIEEARQWRDLKLGNFYFDVPKQPRKVGEHATYYRALDLLRVTYRATYIPAAAAGRELGISERVTKDLLDYQRFPVPSVRLYGNSMVSILVLAHYMMKNPK